MTDQELLREGQVKELYGFSVSWLRRTRREGRGPKFMRFGKMIFYRRRDIEDYVTAHEVQTCTEEQGEGPLTSTKRRNINLTRKGQ
jgi:predicted DNA-binding transcriptional regulator AlpA